MASIVLACDAGPHVGMGHLSRLLGLAATLRQRATVTLAVPVDDEVTSRVDAAGYRWIDRRCMAADEAVRDADWVLFDETGDPELVGALERAAPGVRLAVTEYWKLRDHEVEMAIVPFEPYEGMPPIPARERLEGFDYLFVRPQLEGRGDGGDPERAGGAILVTYGSVDPTDHSADVTEALAAMRVERPVTVVLGAFVSEANARRVRAAAVELGAEVVVNPDDFLDRFERAAVVLCAGGMTLAEAAVLGVPAIVWPHHDAERRFSDHFTAAGTAVPVQARGELAAALRTVEDHVRWREMAQRGRGLVDGGGARRLADRLFATTMRRDGT